MNGNKVRSSSGKKKLRIEILLHLKDRKFTNRFRIVPGVNLILFEIFFNQC